MKAQGVVYVATDMAYGAPAFRPARHPMCPTTLPTWELVSTTFHDRGVTLVWCCQVESEEVPA